MMQVKKRIAVILAWIIVSGTLSARAAELPQVADFTAEAHAARALQVPILVLFMSPSCPYCEQALQDFLVPMRRNTTEYRAKVLMRQINVDSNTKLRDFSGKVTTQDQFAIAHGIRLTPTIKLFDAHGHELTAPIVGLLTPDFYGGVLDNAIDAALAKVRAEPGSQRR